MGEIPGSIWHPACIYRRFVDDWYMGNVVNKTRCDILVTSRARLLMRLLSTNHRVSRLLILYRRLRFLPCHAKTTIFVFVVSWSEYYEMRGTHPSTDRKNSSDLDKLCGSTFSKSRCLNTHKHPRGYATEAEAWPWGLTSLPDCITARKTHICGRYICWSISPPCCLETNATFVILCSWHRMLFSKWVTQNWKCFHHYMGTALLSVISMER